MKIDIECLINVISEENSFAFDYERSAAKLYEGSLEEFSKRKKHLKAVSRWLYSQHTAIWSICSILCLNREQQNNLYIATRAVERWRKRTNYERSIPEGMCRQIERFIFC